MNKFNIEDENIYTITCARCEYEMECHRACEVCHYRIDECLIRQLAAQLLEDTPLINAAYYDAEDELVNDLWSLSDTSLVDFIKLNPISILKGGD